VAARLRALPPAWTYNTENLVADFVTLNHKLRLEKIDLVLGRGCHNHLRGPVPAAGQLDHDDRRHRRCLAVRAIAAAAVCVTSTAPGPTLGVQLCRTLNVNGGMVTAAASWRVLQETRSKKTANRTAIASRALRGP
jgi:hypothetical protein